MNEEEISIEYYEMDSGLSPFLEWESGLPTEIRAQIRKRLNRVRLGNFGDFKLLEGCEGLHELRIHLGPGYRIYFGKRGKKVVILFCGGNKGSQKRDIAKAKKYFQDCFQIGVKHGKNKKIQRPSS